MSHKRFVGLSASLRKLMRKCPPMNQRDFDQHIDRSGVSGWHDPKQRHDHVESMFVTDIREAMKTRGMSQGQLARKWKKSRQYVSRFLDHESIGNPTLQTMIEAALLVGLEFRIETQRPPFHTNL